MPLNEGSTLLGLSEWCGLKCMKLDLRYNDLPCVYISCVSWATYVAAFHAAKENNRHEIISNLHTGADGKFLQGTITSVHYGTADMQTSLSLMAVIYLNAAHFQFAVAWDTMLYDVKSEIATKLWLFQRKITTSKLEEHLPAAGTHQL
ncbi:hypothetical protein KCU85_g316, partial [Aureobasidium melanogenum]